MAATHSVQSTRSVSSVLYVSFELSCSEWKVASTTARGQQPRVVSVPAGDLALVLRELDRAKVRFSLPKTAAVVSCHEAGRDGFWLHRFLRQCGVENLVVDSSSIEVNRRARRAKADGLDAVSLVRLLVRHGEGEKVWSTVNVPSVDDEDLHHTHRELDQLRGERTNHTNRIRGLLTAVGIRLPRKFGLSPAQVDLLRMWNNEPLPAHVKQRLVRELERLELLNRQIRAIELEQVARIRDERTRHVEKVRTLMGLRGVGKTSATILVYEFFGWRQFANRREVAGLAPTPYQSGEANHEQGISKAGNVWIRWIMVELAWSCLRFQPNSPLSQWYVKRFAAGTARTRRTGIVALARKLLIVLSRYVESGEVPEGTLEMSWEKKLRCAAA
jgi:transposase